jgi:uncharacterized protein (DUF427 family)
LRSAEYRRGLSSGHRSASSRHSQRLLAIATAAVIKHRSLKEAAGRDLAHRADRAGGNLQPRAGGPHDHRTFNRIMARRAACPIARCAPATDLWSKGRRFEMTETLAGPVVPAAEERARLKEGVHIERCSRRVRTYFGGKLIADSGHVLLVYETKRPPAYWFPIADVRMEYLEASHQAADTIRWHLAVKDRITQNAARAYLKPTDDRAALEGHLTFFWDKMDAWFEEDEQVFVHPRDPYTRVDTVHSSRHVRVEIDGVTLGETRRPMLLFETGLPIRYYIQKLDVRIDLLEPSEYVTSCPYKGVARHWSARVGDKLVKDIVWSYPAPIPECPKIENLLSFYNEHVDLYVEGVLQDRPTTPFS